MNIREIELKTGLTRANIRFYEKEELIEPVRLENGYRDYSPENLEALLRIKLLRALNISVDEIRRLQKNEVALEPVIVRRLGNIDIEAETLKNAKAVCETIRADGVGYRELEAGKYLAELERLSAGPAVTVDMRPAALENDVIRITPHPWRRFFARTIDQALYGFLFSAFCYLILNLYPHTDGGFRLLSILVMVLLMLVLEPAFISGIGTTPGKWIFGIRVTDEDGRKLSYSGALERTWSVFYKGNGFFLPIYSWVREYKSYKAYTEGAGLDWDCDISYTFKDTGALRFIAAVAALAVIIGAESVVQLQAQLPHNRGDITVAEFAENYNDYLDYFKLAAGKYLDSSGNWQKKQDDGTVYLSLGSLPEPPYKYTVENGVLSSVSFDVEYTGDGFPVGYDNQMIVAAVSYVCAQKDATIWNGTLKRVISHIQEHPLESYRFTEAGITVTCDVEYSGYWAVSDALGPDDSAANRYFHTTFSMVKNPAA